MQHTSIQSLKRCSLLCFVCRSLWSVILYMFITRVCSGVSFFQTDPAPLLFLDGVLFSTQPHVKTPQLLSSVLKVSPSRKINNALHSVKTTLTELFNCKDYNELYSSKYIHCLCFHLEFNMQLGFKTMRNTNIWQKQ